MPTTQANISSGTAGALRSPRQIELDVIDVLEKSLGGSGGIADLILHRSDQNNETLRAIRDFLLSDVPADIAMTDPALYRKLSRLRAEMILRGWYHFFNG